jgi:hypothetical protein
MVLGPETLLWVAEEFLAIEGKREDSLLRSNFSWE